MLRRVSDDLELTPSQSPDSPRREPGPPPTPAPQTPEPAGEAQPPPEPAVFSYRPAGFEAGGFFVVALLFAGFNVLNLLRNWRESLSMIVPVAVNLIFAGISGLIWCLLDEVLVGEEKIHETLYWVHPRSGERRVLKTYEYWRSDYARIHVQHGRTSSSVSLHGKEDSIVLRRIYGGRDAAEKEAREIAERLDIPMLNS